MAIHTQQFRGGCLIVERADERGTDMIPFEIGHRRPSGVFFGHARRGRKFGTECRGRLGGGVGLRSSLLMHLFGQIVGADHIAWREYDRALEYVLQLANIARPDVSSHRLDRLVRQPFERNSVVDCHACQKMLGQDLDVLGSLGEWHRFEWDDIDAIIQVFSEATFRDCSLKIAIGRGDEADVDRYLLVTADRRDRSLLQDPQ